MKKKWNRPIIRRIYKRPPMAEEMTPEQIEASKQAIGKDVARQLVSEATELLYKAFILSGCNTGINGTAEFNDGSQFRLSFQKVQPDQE